MGLLLVFLNYIYAESGIVENPIPQEINAYIKEGVQKNTIVLIDQMIKQKQDAILKITKTDSVKHYEILEFVHKTPKTDLLKYISLYHDIAELIYQKNQLLLYLNVKGITDDYNTDQTCAFIYDYEKIEIINRELYQTEFHDDIAKTAQNIASLFRTCNPPVEKRYLQIVLHIKENLYSKVSPEAAKAYDALGDYSQFSMADFRKAIKYYEEAIRIRGILYGTNTDPRITENYDRLARSIYYYNQDNRAEKLLQHSINIRKKFPTHKDFPLYATYMDKGMYHIMKGEYSKSIYNLNKALAAFEGKINDDYIMVLSELSSVYLNTDDLKNSLIYAKKAYEKAKEFYKDSQHLEVVMYLRYLIQIAEIIEKEENKINSKNK